jgi:OPA family sugar phosphate sensor protein UhpC-like MFS transporter
MNFAAILNVLKPAPHLPEISDPAQVKASYQYWRVRIFYSMYVGYVFYYFSRKSFTFITPFLTTDLGLTKSDIGILASILSLTYGISKFTSGILCDRSNPRYFMAIGLILTGICNILFGLSSSLLALSLCWGLNGLFQAWGWPACTKQLTHWFSRTERGAWWSACTTSHNVGGFLIAYLAAYCGARLGWRYAMFIPGVLCIGVGLWLLNRLRDIPESLGLPSVEKFKGEQQAQFSGKTLKHEDEQIMSVKQILFKQVLNNKYVWILACSYFFVYAVRTAVNYWGPMYLTEVKEYSPLKAAACISGFEVGGFFGILFAGWGSDRLFKGLRVPLMVLSALGLIFAVMGLWYLDLSNFASAVLLIAVIGFLVFAPQMLVGLAAAEFVSKKAASTSNGFAGCFAYLGAAFAGYPLSKITEIYGWYGFIIALVVCSACTFIILLPIWSIRSEPRQEKKPILTVEINNKTLFSEEDPNMA